MKKLETLKETKQGPSWEDPLALLRGRKRRVEAGRQASRLIGSECESLARRVRSQIPSGCAGGVVAIAAPPHRHVAEAELFACLGPSPAGNSAGIIPA